jgi:RNA polymerase sigma factor (TIGR02999 family)
VNDDRDITSLLKAYGDGDREALDEIVGVLYDELHAIAHGRLSRMRPGQTLNTTGLVHEAYLRLARVSGVEWADRGHFFALASTLMRQILLNYSRDRRAQKRGGGASHVTLTEDRMLIPDAHAERLIDLSDMLDRFEVRHPRPATMLSHRYFGGLTNDEIAIATGVSLSTVERDLRFGRAWLARELSESDLGTSIIDEQSGDRA